MTGADEPRPPSLVRLHRWLSTPNPGVALAPDEAPVYPVFAYCALLGLVFHTFNVPLYLLLGVPALSAFNVLSVAIFVGAMTLCRRGRLLPSLTLMVLEVVAHGWIGSLLLGWDAGLHYPVLILVPLVFLATGISIAVQAAAGFALLALYSLCYATVPPEVADISHALTQGLSYLNIVIVFFGLVGVSAFYADAVRRSRRAFAEEYDRAERLLHNILPAAIADRLKAREITIADAFPACSVLFADIVGFTPLSAKVGPRELVDLLNQIFSAFDGFTEELGLEKIKTIGDSYMVAAGIPNPDPNHAGLIAEMGLRIVDYMNALEPIHGEPVSIRIGIHSGPAVAGVIGRKKFIYDLWGDTVNTAARMESQGVPGEIQVSDVTYELLREQYSFEARGALDIKGKGAMETYLLRRRGEG